MSRDKTMDKLLGKKKIETLDIDLFDKPDSEYNKARANWIAEQLRYEMYKKRDMAEAAWDAKYPQGKRDWINDNIRLTATGEQVLIDKINELVEAYNNG